MRRACRDKLAPEQDRDAVADELDLREQVRVEQHGDPAPTQLLEQQPDRAPTHGIERRGGLVEEQHARLTDERLRDTESLLHPLRHALDAAVGGIGQRNELEQPLALGRAAARAAEPLVQLEHLVGGVPAGEAEELGQVTERGTGGARARPRTRHLGLPAPRSHEADEDLHERRLPGPVRAEQADELPLADFEVDPLQRLDGAVALGEAAHGECGPHRGKLPEGRELQPRTGRRGEGPRRGSGLAFRQTC